MEQNLSAQFWRNRRVLVTGHTGFKGSWLSLWLQLLGAEVYGIALGANNSDSIFNVANVENGMKSYLQDINSFPEIVELLHDIKPEIIFHLAAQPLVRASYEDPIETYQTNVMGTINLLEALRQSIAVKVIINVTTDKVYDNDGGERAFKENDPLGGFDPYSNSKACSELVSRSYYEAFYKPKGVGLATVRAGNVIGGGDCAKDRLIPDVISAFSNNRKVILRYPNATRPWQHVLDCLHGYLLLAEKLVEEPTVHSGSWNFGPDVKDIQSVKSVVEAIMELWPAAAAWEAEQGEFPYEAPSLVLANSKAKHMLGWRPKLTLNNSLSEIIDWHLAVSNKRDLRAISFKKIEQYMAS